VSRRIVNEVLDEVEPVVVAEVKEELALDGEADLGLTEDVQGHIVVCE
jgi:hypothetical protein